MRVCNRCNGDMIYSLFWGEYICTTGHCGKHSSIRVGQDGRVALASSITQGDVKKKRGYDAEKHPGWTVQNG